MMKVQMIVTESGEVINFDNVISIGISEELKRDHETTEFVLYAHAVNNDFKTIIKFDDKETAQTCLMSELNRAKQTDGIARFDGDIMARLYEGGRVNESKLKPCPFCGKEVTVTSSSLNQKFLFLHKGLRNCPFYRFDIAWDTAKTLREATELWNRRAESEVADEY